MFSEAFWDRCVIVFTRISMDKKSIRRRERSSGNHTDDERARAYIKVIQEKFSKTMGKSLPYLFLDACYDEQDEDEEKAFKEAMDKLYHMVTGHEYDSGLPTSKFEEVDTEDSKLKKALDEKERELQDKMETLTQATISPKGVLPNNSNQTPPGTQSGVCNPVQTPVKLPKVEEKGFDLLQGMKCKSDRTLYTFYS